MEDLLMGLGNPLLDISADVEEDIFQKYDLKPANAILAEEKHIPLYKELVENYKVSYIAGGATQNSIRVAQWLLQSENSTTYLGCVGKDNFGEELEKAAKQDGLLPLYQKIDTHQTGTCAVLVHKNERSLVANLGAANHFKITHLEDPVVKKHFENSLVFYSAGFFITVSPDTLFKMAKFAAENDRVFCMNLSATFLMQGPFWETMQKLIPYWDIIFGNETEFVAFGKAMKIIGQDESEESALSKIKDVMKALAEMPKINSKMPRGVIATQGKNPTLVYFKDYKDEVVEFPVELCPKEEFVDTNGAGDSFVGGFLAQYSLMKKNKKPISIPDCVKAAHYAAGYIIRRSGCSFSGKPNFELLK
ncbi:hypothetical protein M0811_03693 [Anaeramoeba ignava]|uniref:Adenosine kinase n=1 Tax=Anaeramoeba ignava TaxID=1746090 RepID=A0A9Q0LX96_ANAIG|nr:hypothetical protein M0811_03693 [Anaeramoeba ignava]